MTPQAFCMKIAGHIARVEAKFASTQAYFAPYLTQELPEFTISPTDADWEFEQAFSIEEALREGIRPRIYSNSHLERSAIQRAFAEYLFDRDILLLHGSTVAVDGKAYLFTAKCGTGKSTHTRLWREVFGARAVMVNDDKPFLHIADGLVTAYGSPWSGKHGLSSNISAPLQGICILERGTDNVIRPLSAAEAMPMLLHQSYAPTDPSKTPRLEALLGQLVAAVPLWHMDCNKDPQAARVAYHAMSQIVMFHSQKET